MSDGCSLLYLVGIISVSKKMFRYMAARGAKSPIFRREIGDLFPLETHSHKVPILYILQCHGMMLWLHGLRSYFDMS